MRTPEELIGSRLGQYEVQALIGQGGMAVLYRAFDVNLERPVALKVLSEEAAAEPEVAERFRREARHLATLRHPHIVQIYDFGEQDGLFYIVQELLPGPTLAQRMSEAGAQGKALPREEVLAIAQQLASALDAAHAAGIIHRDVKPDNILWNSAGRLVLTDFGIARHTSADAALTRTGQVLGTPTYLSPEQARGEALTPASDLYALGVILYELLAGHPPFRGSTPMEVVLQHVESAPPPLQGDIPPAVAALVARALAKEPAARFDSASSLAQALEAAWSSATPRPVEQPTRSWEVVQATPAVRPEQPTRAWQATPAPDPTDASETRPTPVPTLPAPSQGNNRALPFLLVGGLLFLLLAAALRGWLGAGEVAEPGSQLSPVAQATLAPTSAAEPSATVAEATAVPSATAALPAPTEVPASSDPIIELEPRLQTGIAAGLVEKQGDKLLNKAQEAEAALATGDSNQATKALRELQREVLKGVRNGQIDSSFAEGILEVIDRIAAHHNLPLLPLEVGEEEEEED